MSYFIKSYFSKLNFFAGRNPVIERKSDCKNYIPENYKTVMLISADFELAWAWRYSKSRKDALHEAKIKALTEKDNVPKIITLCEHFNIPITWLTVGHLFLDSCTRKNGIAHPALPRLPHFENKFSKFAGKDWFEYDPCTNYKQDPEWYCPDLIQRINESTVKHEIGCHTFSHINCRDGVCPPGLMKAELKECKNLARLIGLNLKSFVHPGHIIGNLDVLAEEGFTSFRTDYRNVLGYPKKHDNGLWEFEQTAEFVYRKKWSFDYHIYRYIEIIKRAIKSNTVCVFWFHPSFNPVIVDKILPEVFGFIEDNREKIWLASHGEYIMWLEANSHILK